MKRSGRAAERHESHRWFAGVWDIQTRHEPETIRKLRQAVVAPARGRVLEIGCGTGANFAYYGEDAGPIVASDPDPYMLRRTAKAVAAANRPIAVCRAGAEQLPFSSQSFDTVISTLNFCTIADPKAGLREISRVLRPHGEYRFFDHVRYNHWFGGFWQDLLTPVWRWCGGGCHPNRDVAGLIRAAGFTITEMESLKSVPPIPPLVIVRPVIRGVARSA